MKRAAAVVVAAVVVALVLPVRLLPWRAARTLGRWYGYAAFVPYVLGRRAGQINLRRAYGASMTRQRARRMTLQVFGSLGQAIAEGLQAARRYSRGDRRLDALVDIEDPALRDRILADPRPKILVTGHLGCWDLAIILAGDRHGGGAVMARGIDNRVLDRLLARARGRLGTVIEKRGGAPAALAHLRHGRHVALLVDENAGPRGVPSPFFGRLASSSRLPALLALRSGAPIVAAAAVRRPGGRFLYRLAVVEPAAGAHPGRVRELTASVNAILEAWIRDDPAQWRWIHWRWKTRPDGSEERYGLAERRDCFNPPAGAMAEAGTGHDH